MNTHYNEVTTIQSPIRNVETNYRGKMTLCIVKQIFCGFIYRKYDTIKRL
jgi:hypothetical protein